MNNILAKHPDGTVIEFNDAAHKYFTKNCDNFTSATTLIHDYFPEFDKQGISKKYAEKHNMTQIDVLKKWQHECDVSVILGNMVHKFCEEKLLDQPYTVKPVTDKHRNVLRTADRAVDFLMKNFTFVDSEKIIFSEKYKIAGTIDLLMKRGNVIYILDWKTNKEIKLDNFFKNYGLKCLSHLDDNNYTKYCLQLNLYKWLLLKEKYYDNDIELKLIHLTEDRFKIYPVKDYQKEITEMVADFN